MSLTATIGVKVRYALKMAGITTHQLTVEQARPGEFRVVAILTNDYPAAEEGEVRVIKEDYRIKQVNETDERQTQE